MQLILYEKNRNISFQDSGRFLSRKKPCNISISKKKTVLYKASFRRRTHHVHHLKEILTRIKKSFLVRASKKIPFIDKTSHSQSKGKRQKGFFVMAEPIIVSIHHYNFPSSSCTFGVILFEPFLPWLLSKIYAWIRQ